MKIINEEKPNALKGIADDTGKSEEEIGKLWDKELENYGKKESELNGEDYGILIGKVKDAAGVKGDVDPKNESVSNFLKSNKSAKEFFKL